MIYKLHKYTYVYVLHKQHCGIKYAILFIYLTDNLKLIDRLCVKNQNKQ